MVVANGGGTSWVFELVTTLALVGSTALIGAATRDTADERSLSSRSIFTRPLDELTPETLIRGAIGAIGALRLGLSGCRCPSGEISGRAPRLTGESTPTTSPRPSSGEASIKGEAAALLREKLLSGVEDRYGEDEGPTPTRAAERIASGVTLTPTGTTGRFGSKVCFEGVAAPVAEIFETPVTAFEGEPEVVVVVVAAGARAELVFAGGDVLYE